MDFGYTLLPDGTACLTQYAGEAAFSGCRALTGVSIPDTVAVIEDYAFANCSALTAIDIPDSVVAMGETIFTACEALTRIRLPHAPVTFDKSPFLFCHSLKDIVLSPDHPYLTVTGGMLVDKVAGRLICCPEGLHAGRCTVPAGVRAIAGLAFAGHDTLTAVVIPAAVTDIDNDAFLACPSLAAATVARGSCAEEWARAQGLRCEYAD